MKRILCPKCDNYITFDETKYTEGQSLVFICEHCKKQFSIRIGKTKLKATRKEEVLDEQANSRDYGSIVVVENVFGYKQDVDVSIETADPSMDRKHCVINVSRNKKGKLIYTLRDNQSITGTFLMNEVLGPKDRVRIDEGSIITLGATTLILRIAEEE